MSATLTSPAPRTPRSALPAQPEILSRFGEEEWPDEAHSTGRISEAIQASVRARAGKGRQGALRDAHPKSHGTVRATFCVDRDLPARLAHGVFRPGAEYSAWVRFSNGDADAERADIRGDARGMAIKLLGVTGEKLLGGQAERLTQDFLLISHPTFFTDSPARYATFIERATASGALERLTAPLALGWTGLNIARKITSRRISSPLETRYWSTVASCLGGEPERMAVKYSARPSLPTQTAIPAHPHKDYLRAAMVRALLAEPVSFDFLVQPRAGAWMSVEDPMVEWSEADAPFFKVATLTLHRQRFDSPGVDLFGEDLAFSPWHSLPAHRPLGGINRVRRVVYEDISTLRHQLNGRPIREPTGADQPQ